MEWETASLLYRRPDLYDAVASPDTGTIVDLVTAHRASPAVSMLDLGCGTGALLAGLPNSYSRRLGVDVQPGMIAYARRVRPNLDLRVADIRATRLRVTFDAVVCVGLTLAYMHTADDLAAALTTIATHAHADTVVVLQTLTQPVQREGESVSSTVLDGAPVSVTTSYRWCDPFVDMRRRWTLTRDGDVIVDHLRRRVWLPGHLAAVLATVGLEIIDDTGGYLTCRRVVTGWASGRR